MSEQLILSLPFHYQNSSGENQCIQLVLCPSRSLSNSSRPCSPLLGQLRLHLKQEGHTGHSVSCSRHLQTCFNFLSYWLLKTMNGKPIWAVIHYPCRANCAEEARGTQQTSATANHPSVFPPQSEGALEARFLFNCTWQDNIFLKKFSTGVLKEFCLLCSH